MPKAKPHPLRLVRFDFDFGKFLAAVHYIASRDLPDLTAYKICKLLFLSDKHHLVRYGRPITGDHYCALAYGPIPSMALDLLRALAKDVQQDDENVRRMASRLDVDRQFQYPRFSTTKALEFGDLSKSDLMSLDEVVNEFGDMGFNQLKSITHSVYAYKKTSHKGEHWMRYEDFFREDPGAIDGAHEEMLGACRELAPSKQESTTYEPSPVCKLLILGCRLLIPDRLLENNELRRAFGVPSAVTQKRPLKVT